MADGRWRRRTGQSLRRLLRSSAARWRRRLPGRGQRRGARPVAAGFEATLLASSRPGGRSSGRTGSSRGTTVRDGRGGTALERLVPVGAAAAISTIATWRRWARTWRRSGSGTTSCRARAADRSRSRSRSGWVAGPPISPRPGRGRRGHRGSSRRTPRAGWAAWPSCCTRAAMRCTRRPSARGRRSSSGRMPRPRSSRAPPTSSAGMPTSPTGSGTGWARPPSRARLCSSRYGAVMLDVCWALFEIELHRHPGRRPNDVWTEVTTDGLGIVPHPEWSWWAIRGQLIDAARLSRQLRPVRDHGCRRPCTGARGPRALVRGRPWLVRLHVGTVVRGRGIRRPADLLHDLLGGPLTAEPLLADLRGG